MPVARARNLNLNTVSSEFLDDVTIITGQKPKAYHKIPILLTAFYTLHLDSEPSQHDKPQDLTSTQMSLTALKKCWKRAVSCIDSGRLHIQPHYIFKSSAKHMTKVK